jgi:PAS domain S-box-containing protein
MDPLQYENLSRLFRYVQCSLWQASVTGLPGWDTRASLTSPDLFRWDGVIQDVDAARTVIDVDQRSGETYEQAWYRSRLPEDDVRMRIVCATALRRGDPSYAQEFRCRDRFGRVQWLYEIVTLRTLSPGCWQAFGAVVNVTERKQAEEQLRDRDARSRATFEGAPIGIALVDTDGWITDANGVLQQMLGYSLEELKKRRVRDLTHPEDYPFDRDLYRQVLDGQCPSYQVEKRYIRKDGSFRWGQLTVSVVRDPGGQVQFIIGALLDITDRRRAEQQLRELNETLESRVAQRTAEAEQRAIQLRNLAVQLTHLEQRERRRIAELLHDHLQQMLSAARSSTCGCCTSRTGTGIWVADSARSKNCSGSVRRPLARSPSNFARRSSTTAASARPCIGWPGGSATSTAWPYACRPTCSPAPRPRTLAWPCSRPSANCSSTWSSMRRRLAPMCGCCGWRGTGCASRSVTTVSASIRLLWGPARTKTAASGCFTSGSGSSGWAAPSRCEALPVAEAR